jgi:voltage-gated potassium channel
MLYKREINFIVQFLKFSLGYLLILVFFSIILMYLEKDWTFLDAFYQIVITVSTVGFGEVKPLDTAGRLFIIFVIFFQTGFFVYITSKIVDLVVSGELKEILNYRKLQGMLDKVDNHTILIGLGRLGSSILENLEQLGEDVVVIDKNTDLIKQFQEKYPYFPFLDCDAQDEECLKEARITKAKNLVITISNDADNLFIVVTAKNLNPYLRIVARASTPRNAKKLKQAGASVVFFPEIEAAKLAAMILGKENVYKLLNFILIDENNPFDFEEILVKPCSPIVDKAVRKIFLGDNFGFLIAIKRGETFLIFPAKEEVIKPNDVLIVLGSLEQIAKLRSIVEC